MASTDPTPSTLTKHDEEVKILIKHDEEVKTRTKHGEEATTEYDWNETLRGIARQGDSRALYETLDCAPDILNQIDKTHLVHTPLHEAVEAGQTYFAIEILTLKPSLGRKLNTHGQSPLHLAALHHRELAKRLIKYDRELIRVQGKERKTPLHCVAEAGDTDLLAEFLCACPESIKDLTIRDETALHIAVKERKVAAFRLIFEWIWRSYNGELLIWKDEKGNTVLHIAVSTKQHEIVELLVRRAPIIKNEKNSDGRTALDIAAHEDWTSRNIILGREKATPHEGTKFSKHARSLDVFLQSSEPYFEKVLRFILYCRRELSLDMRNMVLVVAVLIATATFEARGSLVENESTKSPASASGSNVTSIGKVVGDLSYYSISTVSFTASIAVMISVLSLKPFTSFLHLSLVFLAISYGYKMVNISPWQTAFPISLIVLVYAFKLYFDNMEREIKMEMPAIWMELHPRWKAMTPVPVPLERLRMVYRLMKG